jgi:hypothetical protein
MVLIDETAAVGLNMGLVAASSVNVMLAPHGKCRVSPIKANKSIKEAEMPDVAQIGVTGLAVMGPQPSAQFRPAWPPGCSS